jgi:hypothetical protein
MGRINGVKETVVRSVITPLEWIEDKAEWPDQIFRQASFAGSALNEDLKTGLAIIENFEKHKAWEYVKQDRETFFRHQVHVDPEHLPAILEGYKVLVGRGERPTHWRQAVDAVNPRKERSEQNCVHVNGRTTYTRSRTLIAILKRERPDIAERLAQGEFLNVSSAMREAGIQVLNSERCSLTSLRYWWRKCSKNQRRDFMEEIGIIEGKRAQFEGLFDNPLFTPKSRIIDLSGQRFGEWTVLKRWKRSGRNTFWQCSCQCGKIGWVIADMLKPVFYS